MKTINFDNVHVGDIIRCVEDGSCYKVVSINAGESIDAEIMSKTNECTGLYVEIFEDDFEFYEVVDPNVPTEPVNTKHGIKINVETEIDLDKIEAAKKVLSDNGVDKEELDIVMQALGYTLLNVELDPFLNI